MIIEIEFVYPENLLLDIFLYFLCQLQIFWHVGGHIGFCQPWWNFNFIIIWILKLRSLTLKTDMIHYFLCQLQTETCKLIEFWPPYWILVAILNFHCPNYDYWNWIPWPWKPTCWIYFITFYAYCRPRVKFIELWSPYWILVAILNFHCHMIIEIEFLDPENLLLDIFDYFLCHANCRPRKASLLSLAAILDFSGHIEFSLS